jgi:hypothetical protein
VTIHDDRGTNQLSGIGWRGDSNREHRLSWQVGARANDYLLLDPAWGTVGSAGLGGLLTRAGLRRLLSRLRGLGRLLAVVRRLGRLGLLVRSLLRRQLLVRLLLLEENLHEVLEHVLELDRNWDRRRRILVHGYDNMDWTNGDRRERNVDCRSRDECLPRSGRGSWSLGLPTRFCCQRLRSRIHIRVGDRWRSCLHFPAWNRLPDYEGNEGALRVKRETDTYPAEGLYAGGVR